jgi:hypothetical protein
MAYPLGLILALGLFIFWPRPLALTESAAIRAGYAENIRTGQGPVFEPGERVLLSSAPLLIALDLLPPARIGPFILWGLALGALARFLCREGQKFGPAWLLAGLWGWGSLRYLGGVEIGLAALALLSLEARAAQKWTWAGLLGGGMLLTAPASLLYVLVLGWGAPRRYWPLSLGPGLLFWLWAAAYYGQAGLEGLVLPVSSGPVNPLAGLILLALGGYVYTRPEAFSAAGGRWLLLCGGYGLLAQVFRLAPDSSLLLGAVVYVVGGRDVSHPYRFALLALGLALLIFPPPRPNFDPQSPRYHPDLWALAQAGDQAGLLLAQEADFLPPLPLGLDFGPDLALVALHPSPIEMGRPLYIRLDWSLARPYQSPLKGHRFIWNILDHQGANWGFSEQAPPPSIAASPNFSTYHALFLNSGAPFGLYRAELTLDYDGGILGKAQVFEFKLAPPPMSPSGPALHRFGDSSQSVALTLAELKREGGEVILAVEWTVESDFSADYNIFLHLTRPDDPAPLAQGDGPPLGGRYPSRLWQGGEVFRDEYRVSAEGIARGGYVLRLGLFHSERGRLGEAYLIPLVLD